jgi:peptide/nickel transport system substrate-binding protein
MRTPLLKTMLIPVSLILFYTFIVVLSPPPQTHASITEPSTINTIGSIQYTPVFTSGIDTTTYVDAVIESPLTLDPAAPNNEVGRRVIQQVYETLITHDGLDTTTFVPQLATTLPTISADRLTYTFTIREGIRFHNSGTLSAEDVAYSLQRGILQGGYDAPQYLLTEPLLGAGVRDVSELLFASDGIGLTMRGNREAVQNADPSLLRSVCEQVKSRIQANGDTVTFTLNQPWSPFLATLAESWGGIVDKEWVRVQGGWDGGCATWQNYYNLPPQENPFTTRMNGTGPFQLERVVEDAEVVLIANESYWRTREIGPAWEGGPAGEPLFHTIVMHIMPDWDYNSSGGWSSRFPSMQAGDIETTYVEPEHYQALDGYAGEVCDFDLTKPSYHCRDRGPAQFRLYRGNPSNNHTNLLYNWAIASQPANHFLGSGQLDGNGVPPDFFSDVHVRRGFAYCFDWEDYSERIFAGEAILGVGSSPPGMARYNFYGARYRYDLTRCESELEQAWGGVLPTTGFRLQVPYATNDDQTRIILTLLQAGLSEVNPRYQLEMVGVTPEMYAEYRAANRVPMFSASWTIAVEDPYYWFYPAMVDTLPRLANISESLTAPLRNKLYDITALQNPTHREWRYAGLNQLDYQYVFALRLPIPLERHYEQRWVVSPGYPTTYYYALGKE